MRRPIIILWLRSLPLQFARRAGSQTYNLSVPVDEIVLTFSTSQVAPSTPVILLDTRDSMTYATITVRSGYYAPWR